MTCARRRGGARCPAPSTPAGSPSRPDPRPGRRRARFSLRPALALLIGALGLLAALPAAAEAELWSGTLTVQRMNNVGLLGCGTGTVAYCTAHLSSTSFNWKGTTYTIRDVAVLAGSPSGFHFDLDQTFPDIPGLTVHVDGRAFRLADASLQSSQQGTDHQAEWTAPGLSWTVGQKVAVRLTHPPEVHLRVRPETAVEGTSVALEACLRKGDRSATPESTLRIPVRLSHGTSEDGDWGNSLSGHSDGRRPIRTLEHIYIDSQSSCGLVNIPIHRDSDTDDETFTAALGALPPEVIAGATTSDEVTITDSANVVEQPRPTGDWSPTTCSQAGVQSGVVGRTTLIVGRNLLQSNNHAIYGYNKSTIAYDLGGTLTSQRFSHGGTVYEMAAIYYQTHTATTEALHDTLSLQLDRPHTSSIRAALALHAGNKMFHFADADQLNGSTLRWSNAGLSWSEGQRVELCVTVAWVSLSVSPAPVPEGGTATVTAALSRAVPVAVTIPVTMHDIAGQSGPDWAKSLVDDGIPIAAGQKSGSVALAVPEDDDGSDETYRVILDYENLPAEVQSGSPSAVSINVRDRAHADRPQGQDPCPGCARTVLGIAVDPALVAQIYEWRNDPQWVSYKSHTDRWDRVLLAFGETVADASLTPMSAAEAQEFADQPWGTRWVEVAKTLKALEAALAERTQPLGQPQTNPHAALIAQIYEWRNDPQWVSYKAHTDRWDRALLAFGKTVADTSLTAMTAAEAQAFADQGWTRWVEVAKALKQIEGGTQPTAVQTPVVSIAAGSGVTEGASAGFTLTAAPAPAADIAVTVAVAQSGDVAEASALGARTVTIPAGSTSAVFPVATVDDTVDEPDGSVTATLAAGGGYALGDAASATVAVADDDVSVPAILTRRSIAREGSDDAVVFTVRLDRPSAETVFVDYETADGAGDWARTAPATAGADYTAVAGTLLFFPGRTSHTVSVPILDDAIDEGTEYFLLRFSNPDGATLAAGERETQGLIRNSDPLQKMWLSRFGRIVASDAVATVTARLETPRDAGSHVTVGGQRLPLDSSDDGRALADMLTGFAQAFGAPGAPAASDDDPFARHGLSGAWDDPSPSAPRARCAPVTCCSGRRSGRCSGAARGRSSRAGARARRCRGSRRRCRGSA